MANILVPQVDYTSRDYASIRADLLDVASVLAPNWSSRDASDFGVVLVELFSYMGDILNFYIDRAANEGFIATASQKDSILQLAAMLNYQPATYTSATTTINFTNTNTSSVTIPALSQVSTTTVVNGASTKIIFETDSELVLTAGSSGTVTATQGTTISGEFLGVSSGAPSQIFKLDNPKVVKESISVTVNSVLYTYVPYLVDSGLYAPVFTTVQDADGYTYILFGDGSGGRIPATSSDIYATYRVSDGVLGNVAAGNVTYPWYNVPAGVTLSNTVAATGGSDEETTDSIRNNAPQALRALNRAVSLKDFGYLALQVPLVSKAIATSPTANSVALYVKKQGISGYTEADPVNATTVSDSFNSLVTDIQSHFQNKVSPSTSLVVYPPIYMPVRMAITINVMPQNKQSEVELNAMAALASLGSMENTFFADHLPANYITNALNSVSGIDYSTITQLAVPVKTAYWSRNTTTVTLYYSTPTYTMPTITTGSLIVVAGVDSTVNGARTVAGTGTATISSVVYNTLTFTLAGTTVAQTATADGQFSLNQIATIVCDVDEIPIVKSTDIILTMSGGIV